MLKSPSTSLKLWKILVVERLKNLQKDLAQGRKFDAISVAEIAEDNRLPSTLFDSLLVFENLPGHNELYDDLRVSNFQSGVQSAYPVTLTIVPTSDGLEFRLLYDPVSVSKELASWLTKEFSLVFNAILENPLAGNESLRTAQLFRRLCAH